MFGVGVCLAFVIACLVFDWCFLLWCTGHGLGCLGVWYCLVLLCLFAGVDCVGLLNRFLVVVVVFGYVGSRLAASIWCDCCFCVLGLLPVSVWLVDYCVGYWCLLLNSVVIIFTFLFDWFTVY